MPLLDLCEVAAAVIVAEYRRFEPVTGGGDTTDDTTDDSDRGLLRRKADRSPLTAADLASHRIISEGLRRLAPSVPVLSEESPEEEIADRRSWPELWLVDPLDGTREFIERSGEFTINVALVSDRRPLLGIVYEPLRRRASAGIVGEGAWRCERRDGAWSRTPLKTRPLPADSITVLSSHRHRNERLATSLAFLENLFEVARQNSGSALKFCDLAAGDGDVYPRFSACSEWDVAAGDALVTAAGGAVWGLDGQPLQYNCRDTLLSEHFVAVGDPAAQVWSGLLAELP
ncbi:MAG: 3'(2'),5'-bisphosphate nucleotidase CysQ [Halieaceae bacterium]|jgi:3'(2'), 5'-bisphosphate nucleotidase|nr:3'(2'),5'-bisphosphate nucleotidase CysQ [Halieaceae bacterium]